MPTNLMRLCSPAKLQALLSLFWEAPQPEFLRSQRRQPGQNKGSCLSSMKLRACPPSFVDHRMFCKLSWEGDLAARGSSHTHKSMTTVYCSRRSSSSMPGSSAEDFSFLVPDVKGGVLGSWGRFSLLSAKYPRNGGCRRSEKQFTNARGICKRQVAINKQFLKRPFT